MAKFQIENTISRVVLGIYCPASAPMRQIRRRGLRYSVR